MIDCDASHKGLIISTEYETAQIHHSKSIQMTFKKKYGAVCASKSNYVTKINLP